MNDKELEKDRPKPKCSSSFEEANTELMVKSYIGDTVEC